MTKTKFKTYHFVLQTCNINLYKFTAQMYSARVNIMVYMMFQLHEAFYYTKLGWMYDNFFLLRTFTFYHKLTLCKKNSKMYNLPISDENGTLWVLNAPWFCTVLYKSIVWSNYLMITFVDRVNHARYICHWTLIN